MKILITGGAGFIGSHLAEAYLNQGNEVYIIDDLSTGALDNIKHLQENKEQRENFFVTSDTVLNLDKMVE
jgi:UDP-glucose 4-epimerase